MTLQVIKLDDRNSELSIFSPFSGQMILHPEQDEDVKTFEERITKDETLLFIYSELFENYTYISSRFLKLLDKTHENELESPDKLIEKLSIENSIIFNIHKPITESVYFGFMPLDEDES
jgi:hypothetical protein